MIKLLQLITASGFLSAEGYKHNRRPELIYNVPMSLDTKLITHFRSTFSF
jgi:hypothetical protein